MRNINELRAEMESGMYDSRLKDIYVDEKWFHITENDM